MHTSTYESVDQVAAVTLSNHPNTLAVDSMAEAPATDFARATSDVKRAMVVQAAGVHFSGAPDVTRLDGPTHTTGAHDLRDDNSEGR